MTLSEVRGSFEDGDPNPVLEASDEGAGLWGLNSPPFLPPFEMSSVIKDVFFCLLLAS